MPTITLLLGSVVVFLVMLGGTTWFVTVLVRLASRHERSIRVDLDWRRPRLQVDINDDNPDQERGASHNTGR